mmetsp:Transcript_60075/g.106718  ORF Transcript_60075/g.106718 Transcript_60075/m.106718 type:complete len:234 (+) Transcript_60075:557-1258(+)
MAESCGRCPMEATPQAASLVQGPGGDGRRRQVLRRAAEEILRASQAVALSPTEEVAQTAKRSAQCVCQHPAHWRFVASSSAGQHPANCKVSWAGWRQALLRRPQACPGVSATPQKCPRHLCPAIPWAGLPPALERLEEEPAATPTQAPTAADSSRRASSPALGWSPAPPLPPGGERGPAEWLHPVLSDSSQPRPANEHGSAHRERRSPHSGGAFHFSPCPLGGTLARHCRTEE